MAIDWDTILSFKKHNNINVEAISGGISENDAGDNADSDSISDDDDMSDGGMSDDDAGGMGEDDGMSEESGDSMGDSSNMSSGATTDYTKNIPKGVFILREINSKLTILKELDDFYNTVSNTIILLDDGKITKNKLVVKKLKKLLKDIENVRDASTSDNVEDTQVRYALLVNFYHQTVNKLK